MSWCFGSEACGISAPWQGIKPKHLHRKVKSQPLDHQGKAPILYPVIPLFIHIHFISSLPPLQITPALVYLASAKENSIASISGTVYASGIVETRKREIWYGAQLQDPEQVWRAKVDIDYLCFVWGDIQ